LKTSNTSTPKQPSKSPKSRTSTKNSALMFDLNSYDHYMPTYQPALLPRINWVLLSTYQQDIAATYCQATSA
jgi:hypothetical protein